MAFILIFILTCNVLIPKKVEATAVGTEIAIEVGTVLYYIIQGVATGVKIGTIVEKISTGVDTYTVYKKTKGSGTLYKFVNGNDYRIRPQVAQALVDGLTDKQLVELANNVTINEEGMMTSGDISSDTKKAVNGIMINISGSVPMYENYYTGLVEKRNVLSDTQLNAVRDIINQFAYEKLEPSDYKYPYFAIIPTLSLYNPNEVIYRICFSTVPLIIYNQGGNSTDVVPIKDCFNNYVSTEKNTAVRPNRPTNFYFYNYEYQWLSRKAEFSTEGYVFPTNIFAENNISAIGHGIIKIDKTTYTSLKENGLITYEGMEQLQNDVYEIPYSLADIDKDYTYIEKDKSEIVIKDGAVPVVGDIDTVVNQVIEYENSDKEKHITWDNTDSSINKNLIIGVIDGGYVDIPIDTPADLSGVNKRLDEVIEKLGAILGSIGDINALTDEQLKEILKDLDLTNADGLTIEQVREYADEREQAQERELESELDLENFKVDTGIINKFPFCIPFDLIKVIKKMDSTSTAPKFEFPFKFERLGIDETIKLDFKQFESVAVVVRWFILISFILLLIYTTRNLIKG